jgi:hypothetical protein
MLLNPFLLEKAFIQTRREVPRDLGVKMKNRRHNALKKAYLRLIENPFIDYQNSEMLILSDSVTEKCEAKFYRTSRVECRLIEPGNVLCHAFWEGFPCWHRATLEIVENYLLIESSFRGEQIKSVDSVNSSGVAGVNS